jgi:hypothetical protein
VIVDHELAPVDARDRLEASLAARAQGDAGGSRGRS